MCVTIVCYVNSEWAHEVHRDYEYEWFRAVCRVCSSEIQTRTTHLGPFLCILDGERRLVAVCVTSGQSPGSPFLSPSSFIPHIHPPHPHSSSIQTDWGQTVSTNSYKYNRFTRWILFCLFKWSGHQVWDLTDHKLRFRPAPFCFFYIWVVCTQPKCVLHSGNGKFV